MQITPSIYHLPIRLDETLHINAPYADHLHYPSKNPGEPMHYHDTLELGVCRQGSGIFYIGGGVHAFSQGDISVIAPGVVHIAQSAEDDRSGWQFIDLDPATLLGEEYQTIMEAVNRFSGILHPNSDDGVGSLIERLLTIYRSDARFRRDQLLWTSCLILSLLAGRAPLEEKADAGEVSEVSPAVLYISTHYDEQLTVEQLAALCSRSVTSFRRCFEKATGKPPFEYLYEVRVKAAINLLKRTDMPVSEIAGRVGYPTLSSFNRHFLRLTGQTPSQIRKNGI